LKAWHAIRAKERQIAAGKARHGQLPANPPEAEGDARDHAAKAVGVGQVVALRFFARSVRCAPGSRISARAPDYAERNA
jgi:hypothetical protein